MASPLARTAPVPRTLLWLALVLLAALGGGGCASSPTPGSGKTTGKDAFQPATLEALAPFRDADLRLVRLVQDGQSVRLTGTPITLKLGEGGKIAGRSAVNRYFGRFDLSPNGDVQWPPAALGMTRMAGPEDAMRLESQFTQALTATTRLSVSPDALRFSTPDGKNTAEFAR